MTITNIKTKRIVVRIKEPLDKQILEFSRLYFHGNYSEAVRFLCEFSFLLLHRLDGAVIQSLIRE